ncbi:hypothetical protein OS493_026601 [Desmophyllum pertusum]|uniref:Uncharacterized protein n=1 Tax=Desmophyllum pertusum TaxID=174260 RepID=A0A9W9YCZ6_9CNID|nr:hypothetical protein OS493_026601 [Desmophyllum pertusum]
MDKRPLFLGKGRGRGRGNEQTSGKPAAGRAASGRFLSSAKWGDSSNAVNGDGDSSTSLAVSKERKEKADKIKESAKKYLERVDDEFEDSSEDEEINDSEILNKHTKELQK